jgi:hypothetical protein
VAERLESLLQSSDLLFGARDGFAPHGENVMGRVTPEEAVGGH